MTKKFVLISVLGILLMTAPMAMAAKETPQKSSVVQSGSSVENKEAPQPTATAPRTGEQINWYVVAAAGIRGTSTNFILNGTAGQTAVGVGSSDNHTIRHGYWQDFGAGGGTCCNTDGIRGDADDDCTFGCVTVSDLSFLVAYLFQEGPAPVCEEEADADSDCTFGCVTVSDLSFLVTYLFQEGTPPGPCP